MKKTLVALAVLGSFAGVASAATSVTLYGTVDAGYEGWAFKKDFAGVKNTFVQGGTTENNSKFGIKGQEDLGNGLAAVFTLEGNVGADVGGTNSGQLFNRETTVGLKGAFGEVKVGRAKSQMELALGGVVPGHRVADVDLYSVVMSRHSNGLFYSYDNAGFTFGADVTTKGGAVTNTQEGVSSRKIAWGARLGYTGQVGGVTMLARAAYQDDGKTIGSGTTAGRQQKEAGGLLAVVLPYANNNLTVGVAYAQGKGEAQDLYGAKMDGSRIYTDKAKTLSAVIASSFGSNDSAYVKYQERKANGTGTASSTTLYKGNVWAVGYEHNLSKRTSLYADVAYATIKNNPNLTLKTNKGTAIGYSVGVAHNF